MSDGEKPICKVCYERLLEDEESGVTIPYEEAEPFLEVDTDRNYEPEQEPHTIESESDSADAEPSPEQ